MTFSNVFAQNTQKIKVRVVEPQTRAVDDETIDLLCNRLRQAVTLNDLASYDKTQRFVLLPKINVVEKKRTSTVPVKYAVEVEISFFFLDTYNKTILAQETLSRKGVGATEKSAIKQAVQNIKARERRLKTVLTLGKEHATEIINASCEEFLNENAKILNSGTNIALCDLVASMSQTEENAECFAKLIEYYNSLPADQIEKVEKELEDEPDLSWMQTDEENVEQKESEKMKKKIKK